MFTGITWATYLIGFALLSMVWYTYVLVRYFGPEIKQLVLRNQNTVSQRNEVPISNFFIEEKPAEETEAVFNEWEDTTQQDIEDLMRRLKAIIARTEAGNFNRGEFTGYISLVLKEFVSLKDSIYRGAINEFVETECKSKSIPLTQREIELLW